jgi:ADP-ribose pyrophosphatase YjhB (NUDIX family)
MQAFDSGVMPCLSVRDRFVRTAAYLVCRKYTVGALVAAFSDDQLLLVKHRRRARDLWGLPGGFTHRREPAHETACRELREETGYSFAITPDRLVAVYQQPWARHVDMLFTFEQTPVSAGHSGDPDDREIAAVAWWSIRSLPPLNRETTLALLQLEHLGLWSIRG